MKTIKFKKVEKLIEHKIKFLTFEWFLRKKKIDNMISLDYVLRRVDPNYIIEMTNHDEFNLNDRYFYFESKNKIVSLTEQQVKKRMEEEITDDDMEDLEKDIIFHIKTKNF